MILAPGQTVQVLGGGGAGGQRKEGWAEGVAFKGVGQRGRLSQDSGRCLLTGVGEDSSCC